MTTGLHLRLATALALAGALVAPSLAQAGDLEATFDQTFTKPPAASPAKTPALIPFARPAITSRAVYTSPFEQQIAALASAEQGRIGVAAIDLSSGRSVAVLGDQPFPMASTSKVAIVATFLDLADQGKLKLTDSFPLMVPVPSARFSSAVAPVRRGQSISAQGLIELAITRSDNQATDALLAAVGGPTAVNRWLRKTGNAGIRLDRDIATLVRDDGAVNPAVTIDQRDSSTPLAMAKLLTGLYQGQWLSSSSRDVLMGAMSRCVTGRHRMRAMLPEGVRALHKTGTLSNNSSDVGIIEGPDGRAFAVAIYVTGQGGKPNRDSRIATIARALYDGYQAVPTAIQRTAARR